MTDTPSSILLLRLQSTGSNTNLWGGYLNTALSTLEQADKGYQALAVTGDATITWSNYSTGNSLQYAAVKLTGTLTASATLTAPTYNNFLSVYNTAGQTVTIKCAAGTGVAVPNNRKALLFCDGVDYYSATPSWTADSVTPTNNGDILNYSQIATLIANAALPATTGAVRNSASDTTSGYLSQKMAGSGAVVLSTTNPAGNEILNIAVGSLALTDGGTKSGAFTAAANTRYRVDCTSNTVTMTGYATPTVGDVIQIEKFGTNAFTWSLNGSKYYGSTSTPVSTAEGITQAVYTGASRGFIDI